MSAATSYLGRQAQPLTGSGAGQAASGSSPTGARTSGRQPGCGPLDCGGLQAVPGSASWHKKYAARRPRVLGGQELLRLFPKMVRARPPADVGRVPQAHQGAGTRGRELHGRIPMESRGTRPRLGHPGIRSWPATGISTHGSSHRWQLQNPHGTSTAGLCNYARQGSRKPRRGSGKWKTASSRRRTGGGARLRRLTNASLV
jgi:hypothetical protein